MARTALKAAVHHLNASCGDPEPGTYRAFPNPETRRLVDTLDYCYTTLLSLCLTARDK